MELARKRQLLDECPPLAIQRRVVPVEIEPDLAERELPRLLFHSFDGTDRLTHFILEHDARIGVGGLATRQKSAVLREQLRRIPLDAMVLETDSPYLVPARQKARRNTPSHVRTIAAFLAGHLGRPVDEIAHVTTANAETIFGRLLTE